MLLDHKKHFGIDFGTSNSTVGIFDGTSASLVPLELNSFTIPSAVFYNSYNISPVFGRAAIDEYLSGADGRLMRSLKSILGTSLIGETTKIGEINLSFKTVIGNFIRALKLCTEEYVKKEIETIVLGRPVRFVDDNDTADLRAQQQLESIARAQGFKDIVFQYEPVAAALQYEQSINKEEIALVIDIGGGTSDFTIIKLSPIKKNSDSRISDILANSGIHIGGTDFDRLFSFNDVMPHFGRNSFLRPKNLTVPNHLFIDLATWHRINMLYSLKTEKLIEEIYRNSLSPKSIFRLVSIIKKHKGHNLAIGVEKAKIELTENTSTVLDLSFIEQGDYLTLSLSQLNNSINSSVEQLEDKIKETIEDARIKRDNIDTIFLTGGSTSLYLIREMLNNLFPSTKIVTGDLFGSVGLGLAIEAHRQFG